MVEHALDDKRGPLVGRAGIFKELECFFQGSGDVLGIMRGGLGSFGDPRAFAADADLFSGEHVVDDEVAVAELQQPLLFCLRASSRRMARSDSCLAVRSLRSAHRRTVARTRFFSSSVSH